jgi:uncharacterized OsmC-like protein
VNGTAFESIIGTNVNPPVNFIRLGRREFRSGQEREKQNENENIRVSFKIKADATDEQLKELVQLAQKRSPVFDIVSRPVPVSVELKQH